MIEINARATVEQAKTMANLIDRFAEFSVPGISFSVAMTWSSLTPNRNYAEILITGDDDKIHRLFYIRPDGIIADSR